MLLLARVRMFLARHRSIGRAGFVACIAVIGLGAFSAVDSLEREREAWGSTVPVVVADRPLAPGDAADGNSMSLRHWPAALVPPAALRELPASVVSQPVGQGEAVTTADVGTAPGAAGLVPAGWVVVAIPLDATLRPPLHIGDRVGVVIGVERLSDGIVIEPSATAVMLAVPSTDAPMAAGAAASGSGTVALILEP